MIENTQNSHNYKFRNIMFALICKFMIKKGIGGKFIRNVLEYHKNSEYFTIPDNTSPKKKTKIVIEASINNLIRSNYGFSEAEITGNYHRMFEYFLSFFSSPNSAFEWHRTIEGGNFWWNLHNDWEHHIMKEYTVLKNKGIIE